jgi:thiosulfate dehydrogenase [quinone] large subunit
MAQPASDTHEQADAAGPRRHAAGPPLASRVVPAWALLPLRLFLGVTFIDAGLGKLLSPAWFGAGPRSFAALAEGFATGSPLAGPVRAVVLAHPFLFALLLAVLELVVGVWTVIGLASRLAAGVGMGLSLTFFLTASWRVRPFFYGADLPFAAGWLTLLLAGHGGLPSVDATLLRRHRSERGLGPAEVVGVPFDCLQQQCAQADQHGRCASAAGDPCAGTGCPLVGARPAPVAQDASRRAFLAAAGKAAGMLVATLAAAAGAAPLVAGREQPRAAGRLAGRQRVGYLWQVPVGQAQLFELPRSREPAIMIRLAQDQLVAYGAICTHARCVVGFDPASRLIVCACHGAEFDPRRGAAVVAGPAPRPLPRVDLRIDRDAVYVQG